MTVIVNPYAAGGRGAERWHRVAPLLPERPVGTVVRMLGPDCTVVDAVRDALACGEREFVAAGGDGTVNALMNALALMLDAQELRSVALGAVGLGSSNDFHKPFLHTLAGFPAKVEFDRAQPHDAGCLTFDACRRFFLVNASAGVTASANAFFNRPDRTLRFLKSLSTAAAISYAAVRTIAADEGVTATILSEDVELSNFTLSNLAILQSPYCSGSLHFPEGAARGRFSVYLHRRLGRRQLLELLMALRRGSCSRALHWNTRELSVTAARPFTVEYDGETIDTSAARCSVYPDIIRICP